MVRSLAGKHPLYYEAILQLREASASVPDFVNGDLQRYAIPVAKVKKVTNGYDYYLADSKYAKALGKRLQQQFGGEVRITASLFGQKDGKETYRLTVLFRQAAFRKGDLVAYRGDAYTILSAARDILLRHSQSGKKVHVRWKNVGSLRRMAARE